MSQHRLKAAIKVATEEFARVLFSIFTSATLSEIGTQGASTQAKASKKAEAFASVKRKARKTKARVKKPLAEIHKETLLTIQEAGSEGIAIGQIARTTGIDVLSLHKALRTLVADGDVVRKGERRGTRYFAEE